jgi:hypothetical protein
MTQIKFTIESDIVAAFKARCAREDVSMTSEVRRFMETCKPVKVAKTKTLTRPQRRKAVADIICLLTTLMESEAEYRDSIPEAFTERYETADLACEQLVEAITCLEEAF